MPMKLQIGLSESSYWWKRALDQEKTAYQILDSKTHRIDAQEFPVVILTKKPSQEAILKYREYLAAGGSLVAVKEVLGLFEDSHGKIADHVFGVENPATFQLSEGESCLKKFFFNKNQYVTETVARHPAGRWRRELVE